MYYAAYSFCFVYFSNGMDVNVKLKKKTSYDNKLFILASSISLQTN